MTVGLKTMMADLDPGRRRKVEDRAAELITEEMTLRELRKARQLPRSASRANSISARTASRGSSSAPICSSRRCEGRWRPWAGACR